MFVSSLFLSQPLAAVLHVVNDEAIGMNTQRRGPSGLMAEGEKCAKSTSAELIVLPSRICPVNGRERGKSDRSLYGQDAYKLLRRQ